MTSIHSINSDIDDEGSIILETQSSDRSISEYDETLKALAEHKSSLVYNYALDKTISLMEGLVGCSKEEIQNDRKVTDFASRAVEHLSQYEWTYFDASTVAQLELFLHAVSSVLHVLSKSVLMMDTNIRTSLYKSISKFWRIYRTTNIINANIMFSLREIRNCLRKIKDDKSSAANAVRIGSNVFSAAVSIAQKEYLAAFGSFVSILDFEYAAGEWYYDWTINRERFYLLCLENNNTKTREIKKFYKKLYKLSLKEFAKVKRKNTKFRNFEYKMLKSGGAVTGCSLPDHIDTLLIGYLLLIQQLYQRFLPKLEKYIRALVTFCNDIVETHVKKQLTFKAIEILYIIKENCKDKEIKEEIESNFEKWTNYSKPPTPVRSLSSPTPSSNNKTEPSPPSTPTSAYTSFSTQRQSFYSTLPSRQRNRLSVQSFRSVRSIPTKVTRAAKSFSQRYSHRNIINNVIKLFEERTKIEKNINDVKETYNQILNNNNVDNKGKDSADYLDLFSKLKELLEEKEKRKDSLPSLPPLSLSEGFGFPFVHKEPEVINNNYIQKEEKIVYVNNYYEKVREPEIIYVKVKKNEEKIKEKIEDKVDKVDEIVEADRVEVDEPKKEEQPETIEITEIIEVKMNIDEQKQPLEITEIVEVKMNIDEPKKEEQPLEITEIDEVKMNIDEPKKEEQPLEPVEVTEIDEVKVNEKEEQLSETISPKEIDEIDEVKMNAKNLEEDNPEDKCKKSDESDSIHSVNQNSSHSEEEINGLDVEESNNTRSIPEIILFHPEEKKSKEVKINNVNNIIVTHNINNITHIEESVKAPKIIVTNNIINNVTHVEEDSALTRFVKKIVKGVEIMVDKALEGHQAAILKSANNSSLSVNKIDETNEKEEVTEDVEDVVEVEEVEEVEEIEVKEVKVIESVVVG